MDQEQLLSLLAQIEEAGGIDTITPEAFEQLLQLGPQAQEAGAAMPHPQTGEYSPYALYDYLQGMAQEPMPEMENPLPNPTNMGGGKGVPWNVERSNLPSALKIWRARQKNID